MNKENRKKVLDELEKLYGGEKCGLDFTSPFELLIATMLSAQCTDVRVNIVTGELFKEYNTPEKLLTLNEGELREKIKSCGLSNTKAKNILLTCHMLLSEYNGVVPETMEELIKLPGVGRKTANVVMSNAFDVPAIAVDTHVFRIAHKLKLVGPSADTPQKTEDALLKLYPRQYWGPINHQWVLFGRQICIARRPKCAECFLSDLCPNSGK